MGACPWLAATVCAQAVTPLPPPPLLPAELAWSIDLPSPPSGGGALDGERVYIPLEGAEIVALARETGETLWSHPVYSRWPPVLAGRFVAAAASDTLHLLDRKTGRSVWRTSLPSPPAAAMTSTGDRLVVPLQSGTILAVSLADGRTLWQQPVGAVPVGAGAADETGILYFALNDSRTVAVSGADGGVRWTQQLAGTLSPPVVSHDRVFVGSTDNTLYALQAANGALAWRWTAGGDVIGSAVDGDTVYVVSLDHILRAHQRGNGNQRWKETLAARPTLPPGAAGGVVWVAGSPSTLTVFGGRTGMAIASVDAPAKLQGAPLVDAALRPFRVAIVFVTRDGGVLGLRPTGMMFREAPPVPLTALPGRALARESDP